MPRIPSRLTAAERARCDRLLRATDHVAPFFRLEMERYPQVYADMMRIIREYRLGRPLLAVCRSTLVRMAEHRPTGLSR